MAKTFTLDDKQVAVFERWRKFKLAEFNKEHPDYEEEDCAPMSVFIFEFQAGSIGSSEKVYFTPDGDDQDGLDLSYDDDGNWLCPGAFHV